MTERQSDMPYNQGDIGQGIAPLAPKPQQAHALTMNDPDQLARALGAVDLTEQEEEELLKQALMINRQLKEELKIREDRAQSGKNRLGSGRRPTLPPIETSTKLDKKKKIYGASMSRSVDDKSRSPPKARSSIGARKPPSASPTKKGGSAPPGVTRSKTFVDSKPDWNGRFSYE